MTDRPLRECLIRRLHLCVAEHMRMAADHLLTQPYEQIGHRELTALGTNLGVEHHLEEQIAELFAKPIDGIGLDGFEDFVGFLDQVGLERAACLLAIPGTARRPTETMLGRYCSSSAAWRSSHYTVGVCKGRYVRGDVHG